MQDRVGVLRGERVFVEIVCGVGEGVKKKFSLCAAAVFMRWPQAPAARCLPLGAVQRLSCDKRWTAVTAKQCVASFLRTLRNNSASGNGDPFSFVVLQSRFRGQTPLISSALSPEYYKG